MGRILWVTKKKVAIRYQIGYNREGFKPAWEPANDQQTILRLEKQAGRAAQNAGAG